VGGSVRHPDEFSRTRRIGGPFHVKLARRLRNDATTPERRLWTWLRTLRRLHGLHFRRQIPIGPYVADFGCHAAKLIIELDGPFHEPEKDRERDTWFAKAGYRTLRFSNDLAALQWDRVVAEIEHALGLGPRLDGPLARLQTDPLPRGESGGPRASGGSRVGSSLHQHEISGKPPPPTPPLKGEGSTGGAAR